jgi:hypothetical protein
VSAVDDYNPYPVAWECARPVRWGARKAWRGAQVTGMYVQNWRHRGAGEEASGVVPADAVNGIDAVKNRADRPRGKNWNTESTDEETTYYHHTKSTRKESR